MPGKEELQRLLDAYRAGEISRQRIMLALGIVDYRELASLLAAQAATAEPRHAAPAFTERLKAGAHG